MIENLKMLINNAYTPLSGFKVSCVLLMKNNQEFVGVNIENPSFKSGLCAEQVALSAAISEGYSKGDFKEIHVMGSGDDITYPCYLCRQWLIEFFNENDAVVCYNKEGNSKKFTIKELCPYAFELKEKPKND